MTAAPHLSTLVLSPAAGDTIPGAEAQRVMSAANKTGAGTLLGGRIVVLCNRATHQPDRYTVMLDHADVGGALAARHAHAIISALQVTIGG